MNAMIRHKTCKACPTGLPHFQTIIHFLSPSESQSWDPLIAHRLDPQLISFKTIYVSTLVVEGKGIQNDIIIVQIIVNSMLVSTILTLKCIQNVFCIHLFNSYSSHKHFKGFKTRENFSFAFKLNKFLVKYIESLANICSKNSYRIQCMQNMHRMSAPILPVLYPGL